MKKIFALVLVFVMVLSFAACGGEDVKQTSSGETVDPNTVEIVNNAFSKTKELIKTAKALGYEGTVVVSATVDDVTTSTNYTVGIDYIDGENGRNYACEIVQKSGEIANEAQIYGDGKSNYAYKAGTTYILSKHKDTDEFVNDLFSDIELIDIGDVTATKTTIIDASIGGHCFVIEYDVKNFNAEKVFGEEFFPISQLKNLAAKKLMVSGTVDSQGRLTSQNITYEFDYDIDVQVETSSESKTEETTSNNSSSKKAKASSKTETSSEAPAVTTVTKKATNVFKYNATFNYDIEEVKVPDRIVFGKDEDGNEIKNTEISVVDFNKLSAVEMPETDKKEDNKTEKK